jgi:predicted amidohydrolase YtcJ
MNRANSSHIAPADLLLKNGLIHKMDRDHTIASALVIRNGSLIYVGDDSVASQLAGTRSRVIDLQGKLVLPGFFDCHTHAPCGADEIYSVILNQLDSLDAYRQAIRAFLEAHPDLSLLRGVGWHPPFFPPEGPARQLLDEWVPGIPAVLYAQDYHSVWVNTPALELAGITQATPNPVGGFIQRDSSGNPSGTLHESAVGLVERIIPPYTVDQLVAGLQYFQQIAHSYGITSIHIPHLGDVVRELEALYRLIDEGMLDLRVVAGLVVQPEDDLAVVERLVAQRLAVKEHMQALGNTGNPPLFEITTAKIFIDGVIESATAYLEQPYAHRPDWRGASLWDVERYKAMCAALDRAGFQIHVHAIGDAAVRTALDGFAFARQANRALHLSGRAPRHGVTHLQLVNPADLQRFADLEVIAFPQPYWFVVDPFYDQAVAYLGQARADRQYPLKSFFDRGVLVASASDYPVTIPARPLNAIENGVTRAQPGESDPARVLNPAERVTLPQMLESFTVNGARAFGMEGFTGYLEVGRQADLIVLDRNIFDLAPAQIHTAEVLLTIFNGREVYRSQDTNQDY